MTHDPNANASNATANPRAHDDGSSSRVIPEPAHDQRELAHLMLETFPRVVAQISCALRRSSPVQNPSQFHLLRRLRDGAASMHELAESAKVRMPTVSRTVDAMCEHGWVTRERDSADKRLVHVTITPEGHNVLDETEAIAQKHALTLLQSLSPEALEALSLGMPALHAAVVHNDKELE
jgi:DNA-binding MarR family transcriptional regulator